MSALRARLARFVQRLKADPSFHERLKDWPNDLRMNTVASELAPALYAAHSGFVRGATVEPWTSLHPAVRYAWERRAATAIRGVR